MKNKYIYNKYVIFIGYGILLFFFLSIFLVVFQTIGLPKSKEEFYYNLILYIFFLSFIVPIFIWMINMSNVKIYVDDTGLWYTSFFKKIKIEWKDIVRVEKKYLYSGAFPFGGPPRDIEIETKNCKNLKIFYFLSRDFESSASVDAIEELDSYIRKCSEQVNGRF